MPSMRRLKATARMTASVTGVAELRARARQPSGVAGHFVRVTAKNIAVASTEHGGELVARDRGLGEAEVVAVREERRRRREEQDEAREVPLCGVRGSSR